MTVNFITPQDLDSFRTQLLSDLRGLITSTPSQEKKQWLKSTEVKDLLKISSGTLQNLRITGVLPFTKLNGTLYYKYEDIMKALNKQV